MIVWARRSSLPSQATRASTASTWLGRSRQAICRTLCWPREKATASSAKYTAVGFGHDRHVYPGPKGLFDQALLTLSLDIDRNSRSLVIRSVRLYWGLIHRPMTPEFDEAARWAPRPAGPPELLTLGACAGTPASMRSVAQLRSNSANTAAIPSIAFPDEGRAIDLTIQLLRT